MAKTLIEKADAMAKAFGDLMVGLAKEGTAIQGYTKAWEAYHKYLKERLNYTLAKPSKEEALKSMLSSPCDEDNSNYPNQI